MIPLIVLMQKGSDKMTEKTLGILGGLGPMASAYFYELITAHTFAEKDQDHIDIVISSKATTPDRTAYIVGESDADPTAIMMQEAEKLEQYGADLLVMPCNTAHFFYDSVRRSVSVPIMNIVDVTVGKCKELGAARIGLLATRGTVETHVYERACRRFGISLVLPEPEEQDAVTEIIYGQIKQGKAPDLDRFLAVSDKLTERGCERIVLGCTELSLVKKDYRLPPRFVDSMEALAEAAILECGKKTVGFAF